ncbi:sensor histidine kinase [Actinopolyspora saharensis]|uniref:histidine kinase n=1 Tax=Actinopolyspora saharensis TaxID=995062 RepID=A0A1H1G391_9ACTN|nr:histidine kinase [Actinopolyspora saharensis]SDR07545.1 Signal transduction histidine kinase [Actinopolyspora saharensis]
MRYQTDSDTAGSPTLRERLPGCARRCADAVRSQWIFAALLGITWCGEVLLVLARGSAVGLGLAVPTVLLLLALAAPRRPAACGVLGAGFLVLATALTRFAGIESGPGILRGVSFTENFAGMLLVLHAFRALSRIKAASVTACLVAACLLAVFARSPLGVLPHGPQGDIFGLSLSRVLEVGGLQLVLAVGTGLYLRGSRRPTTQHPTAVLLRKHWPVIAVLSVLLFYQLFNDGFGVQPFDRVFLFTSSAIMAVLAVFAPLRPLQAALFGAATLFLTVGATVLLRIEGSTSLLGPLPPGTVASGMLLVAFAVRLRPLREAAAATAALTSAAVAGVFLMPRNLHGYGTMPPTALFQPLFLGGVLLVLSVGTGMYFRARDEERARGVSAAVAEAQHAERMALARELHDVVAHHVTGIVVQAQAGFTVAERNPRAARESLERISASGTEALTAMRRLVGSMRDGEASASGEIASTDLRADLRELLEHHGTGEAGAETRLDVVLDTEVPQEVARSALRLVQESITNSDKHGHDVSVIDVTVHTVSRELLVWVEDDGSSGGGSPAGGSGGYGLVGMRERIELLGGTLTAGPAPRGGWQVEARLPLTDSDAGRGRA